MPGLAALGAGITVGLGNRDVGIVRRILDRYGFPIITALKMESVYSPKVDGNNEMNNLIERLRD
jgi:hypothetical protein